MTTPHFPGDRPDGPSLARPFLGRGAAAGMPSAVPDRSEQLVRAYTITGGRTRAASPEGFDALGFESMVSLTPSGQAELPRLTFERQKIARHCDQPLSIAELSSALHLPIGVARVLVADLLAAGLLQRFDTPQDVMTDISLVRELIDGIRNL